MDDWLKSLVELVPAIRGGDWTVTPLGGGITNRNFRVDVAGESYVLRVAGQNTELLGIHRDHEVACARAAAELGIGPKLVVYLPEKSLLVTRFVPGRELTAEDVRQPAVLRRLIASLRRYHEGPAGPGAFSAFRTIQDYFARALERGVVFPDSIGRTFESLSRVEHALGTDEPPCPCHNDLLPANFLDDGAMVWIIDWEYGGMGDRFFDLGNLAANNEFQDEHEQSLLRLYFGEVRPDHQRCLRLMRMVSDMREAMWGFLQAAISSLDYDYRAYGRKHLERFQSACRACGLA